MVTAGSHYRKLQYSLLQQVVSLKFRQTCDITWFPVGLETTLYVPQYSLRLPTANANRPSVHFKHLNPLLSPLKYCENAPF